MTKHTPTPWRWQGEDYRGGWGWMLLVGPSGEGVACGADGDQPFHGLRAHIPIDPALCITGMAAHGKDRAPGFHILQPDAEFLLAAVNAHEPLVAALIKLRDAAAKLHEEADCFSVSGVYFSEECMGHKGLGLVDEALDAAYQALLMVGVTP